MKPSGDCTGLDKQNTVDQSQFITPYGIRIVLSRAENRVNFPELIKYFTVVHGGICLIRVKDFHVSVSANGQEEHFKININKWMGDNFRATLCPCWLNNSSWKIKTELGIVYDRGVSLSYDFNQKKCRALFNMRPFNL